jgi:UPF0755 protein
MVKKIIFVLFLSAFTFSLVSSCRNTNEAEENIEINIRKGEGVAVIAQYLKEKKLILSKTLFLFLTEITKSQNKLKAGLYSFSKKDGVFKILKSLKNGSKNLLRITVPEGNNIKQTAEIISRVLPINKDKFIEIAQLDNLEGYLMPETYLVNSNMSEKDLIVMMRNEFEKKLSADMRQKAAEIKKSLKDIIILASIVEKEAVKAEERPIIASVFYNRLDKGIPLQSCATVLYAMGITKEKLSIEDTKFESPYNTYIHYGLPPSPICSPGIASVKAVLEPANTDNLYFVSNGDGTHLFASSFEDHKNAKKAASRNRRENKK